MRQEQGSGKDRPPDAEGSAAWDRAYLEQGRLWGGSPFPVEDLPAGGLILDLGCGNGKLLASVTGRPCCYIGIDSSPQACRLARRAADSKATCILTADARALPLRSGSVDIVVASHVAGHLVAGDRAILFREAARVLREGGLLLFSDFSVGDFRSGKGIEVEERTFLRMNGIATHYFTEEEVRGLLGLLTVRDLATLRRQMKVRGRAYPRAEIIASFVKE